MAALEQTEAFALASELTMLAAQAVTSGPVIQPLLTGKYSTLFLPAVALGIVVPLRAELRGLRGGHRTRAGRLVTSVLVLLGGLALRWSLVYAGKDTADDPAAYFEQTR
jgi:formate-dependent nitrite reductase membrane component NrfD